MWKLYDIFIISDKSVKIMIDLFEYIERKYEFMIVIINRKYIISSSKYWFPAFMWVIWPFPFVHSTSHQTIIDLSYFSSFHINKIRVRNDLSQKDFSTKKNFSLKWNDVHERSAHNVRVSLNVHEEALSWCISLSSLNKLYNYVKYTHLYGLLRTWHCRL